MIPVTITSVLQRWYLGSIILDEQESGKLIRCVLGCLLEIQGVILFVELCLEVDESS